VCVRSSRLKEGGQINNEDYLCRTTSLALPSKSERANVASVWAARFRLVACSAAEQQGRRLLAAFFSLFSGC
jgi:hypothetical protein